ncbi:general secretion pathway protein M [Desulfuromusa kysingii]|uniref:General secretion pathway protein M n=1 Tax=Desulfuromusa kysingii TaxID=37625 RepID=A0A1H3W331_9BACT|nr:type II secretion system protein GspM [Desulfuromusa kysingii]SDZ81456.1 general secretion pathway protein M [Desulfuromusa kysingii]
MIKHLSPREKVIVATGLIILLLLFVWFVLLNPYLETMRSLEGKIVTHRQNLQKVETMRDQISQLREDLAGVKIAKQGAKPLFSLVESMAVQTGVREQLLSMRPQPTTTQGQFRQQLVEIRLEKISLPQVVKLLHAIEYRSAGVQVKSMQVKPRFEDRSMLDVNMVLMSLESL